MQNKPNFQKSQMNVSIYNTTEYENKSDWTLGQNKPNSNPIKPNFKPPGNEPNKLKRKRGYQELFCGSGLPERLTF